MKITPVPDAASGMSLLENEIFDCILLDYQLPDKDGFEIMKEVRNTKNKTVPVIILTNMDNEDLGLEMIKNGAQDYLVKNRVNGKHLIHVIRYAIERKKLSNRLLKKEMELARVEQKAAIGIMMAGLAHNLNNPLSAISGQLKMLTKYNVPQEYMIKTIDGFKKNINRIATIVSDMLSISKTQPDDYSYNDLTVILKNSLKYLENLIGKRQISIRTDFDDDLYIKCSRIEIEQSLTQIYDNALDALPEGGTITIKTYGAKEYIVACIRDDGKGMSEEERKKMFEPFFTTKSGMAARGLGVSVVERIMNRHQGAIKVQSKIGKGTIVQLIFPRISEEALAKYNLVNSAE
jgi:signal transduction histidine kinase